MLGTAVFIILNSHILTKLQNIDLTSQSFWMGLLNHREYVWTVTLRIFGQHPLLGVGSRNFSSLCREILAEMGLTSPEDFSHSHNIFFQNVVAHGFIAGFAYLGIFLSLFRLVVRSLKTVSSEIMTWAVFSILFVYVFHGLVDVAPYNEEIIPFIWGSVGLLMGMVVKGRQKWHDKLEYCFSVGLSLKMMKYIREKGYDEELITLLERYYTSRQALKMLSNFILQGNDDTYWKALQNPKIREMLRYSYPTFFDKPEVPFKAFLALHFPKIFTEDMSNSARKILRNISKKYVTFKKGNERSVTVETLLSAARQKRRKTAFYTL